LDVVRNRLLSPESVTGRGDKDTNPIFGKAEQLGKEILWSPEYYPGYHQRANELFRKNFWRFIREHGKIPYQLYLPGNLGGLGLYPTPAEREWLRSQIPDWHLRCITCVREGGHPDISRALRAWGTSGLSVRGLEVPLIAENEILSLLREFLPVVSVEQAFEEVLERGVSYPKTRPRYVDKVKHIKRNGYCDLRDTIRAMTAPPFWDTRVKHGRGWATRPFHLRTEIVKQYCEPKVDDYKPTELDTVIEEWNKSYLEDSYFILKEYATMATEFAVESIGVGSADVGASVGLRVSNHKLFSST
jgi:hypothetical protein